MPQTPATTALCEVDSRCGSSDHTVALHQLYNSNVLDQFLAKKKGCQSIVSLTSCNGGSIDEHKRQINARNGQFVPVVDEKVKLNPLLSVVGKRRELFEYDQNHTHGQHYKYAQQYEH